jgi:hypothetical protein
VDRTALIRLLPLPLSWKLQPERRWSLLSRGSDMVIIDGAQHTVDALRRIYFAAARREMHEDASRGFPVLRADRSSFVRAFEDIMRTRPQIAIALADKLISRAEALDYPGTYPEVLAYCASALTSTERSVPNVVARREARGLLRKAVKQLGAPRRDDSDSISVDQLLRHEFVLRTSIRFGSKREVG